MANDKNITLLVADRNLTVYCMVRRNADNYFLDNTDGEFRAVSVDPYIYLTENSTVSGFYELAESRAAWEDGEYDVFIYSRLGATPNLSSDDIIGGGTMEMFEDLEINQFTNIYYSNLILDYIATLSPGIGPTEHIYTLEAPVGTPCADARIYLSTDTLKANIIHEGVTNALGQVTFNVDLPVGTTVYLWRYKTGIDFVNPDVEEI